MPKSYDCIVIGGGHNGLTCAAYLAKAGKKILVLERRHVLGGAAVTEEIYPGFKYSVCSYVVSLLRPHIIRDLNLPKHGLEILPLECSFTPAYDGPGLVRWPCGEKTREIARYSQRILKFTQGGKKMAHMSRCQTHHRQSSSQTDVLKSQGFTATLVTAKPFKDLSLRDLQYFIKMMTMSAVDF